MKRSRILIGPAIILAAVVSAVSLFGFYKPTITHADASCIQYGGFNHSVAFIEAQQQGFFAKEGLNVCYNQVSSSQQQINSLLSGQYQFIASTADNAVNQYVNNNEPVQIVAGGDQGAGLDLIVNTANGIHSIADLKGKTVAVDAPNSGFVLVLTLL